ncbi:hypothetical protein CBS101457_006795 [Exobasidium rhododendri]|nr:hypothetical protein CBS101457_006795 [Exobasidium rhododendri]
MDVGACSSDSDKIVSPKKRLPFRQNRLFSEEEGEILEPPITTLHKSCSNICLPQIRDKEVQHEVVEDEMKERYLFTSEDEGSSSLSSLSEVSTSVTEERLEDEHLQGAAGEATGGALAQASDADICESKIEEEETNEDIVRGGHLQDSEIDRCERRHDEDATKKDLKERLDAKDEEVRQLRSRMAALEEKLAEMQASRIAREGEEIALKHKGDLHWLRIGQLESQSDRLKERVDTLDTDLVKGRLSIQREVEGLRDDLEETMDENESVKARFCQQKASTEARFKEMEEVLSGLQTIKEGLSSAREQSSLDHMKLSVEEAGQEAKKRKREFEEQRSSYRAMLQKEMQDIESVGDV